MTTPMINPTMYGTYTDASMFMNNIKTSIMYNVIPQLQTGNVIVDTLTTLFLISSIGAILSKAPTFLSYLKDKLVSLIKVIIERLKLMFKLKKTETTFTKNIVINEVTENKELNQLYNAYYWYLTNNVNLINETPLNFSYTKSIELNNNRELLDNTLNKALMKNRSKSFDFKGYTIKYSFSNEIINIYADKERKRENNIINLETEYDSNKKEDIFDELSRHVMKEFARSKETHIWEQKLYMSRNGKWEESKSNNKRNISTLILKENQKEKLLTDVKNFCDSEMWYNDRDIPYTRGYLLYGPPGTGKTSFIKGLSLMCKRHLHYLVLNEVKSDSELLDLLKNIDYKKTIMVIEDIDCASNIIKDRSSPQEQPKTEDPNKDKLIVDVIKTLTDKNPVEKSQTNLTLSGILNALDGLFTTNGRILIITSNKPSIIDKAILRPGRIDIKECFNYCDHYQIVNLYNNFFENKITLKEVKNIEEFRYSPADVTGAFLRNKNDPEKAIKELENGINKDFDINLIV